MLLWTVEGKKTMSYWYEPKDKDVDLDDQDLNIYLDDRKFYYDEGTNNYVTVKLSLIRKLLEEQKRPN